MLFRSVTAATSAVTVKATDKLRSVAAPDFNGTTPTLSAALIDSSTAVVTGATVNASTRGGTTAFSSSTVSISQQVSSVADISNDSVSIQEDSGTYSGNVLSNDSFEGTPTAVVIATSPSSGSATIANSGAFTYTPAANFNGTDQFTYTVTSAGVTETATVSITVNAVNDAPVATGSTSLSAINEEIGRAHV